MSASDNRAAYAPADPLARAAQLYARLAIGAAFLSAVAARFGLWGTRSSWKNFADFERYTAQVCAFMPAAAIPFLAWSATVGETAFGVALIAGFRLRASALGAAGLLFMFATAMAISQGIKSPLDYSVYSGSAAALLLALSVPPAASAPR